MLAGRPRDRAGGSRAGRRRGPRCGAAPRRRPETGRRSAPPTRRRCSRTPAARGNSPQMSSPDAYGLPSRSTRSNSVAAPHRRAGRQAGDDRQVAGQRLVEHALGPRHRARRPPPRSAVAGLPDLAVVRAQAQHVREADPLQPVGLLDPRRRRCPTSAPGTGSAAAAARCARTGVRSSDSGLRLRQLQLRGHRVLVRPQRRVERVLDRSRLAGREVRAVRTPCSPTPWQGHA